MPPSFAGNQQLIWIGQQLQPDVPLYEVPYRYTIRGRIDPHRFADAFGQLVSRSEVLRTVATDDQWTQSAVRAVRDEECRVIDVSSAPDPQADADRIVNERLAGRFDHTRSLCDAILLRLSADNWEFYLTIHHALTDAFAGRAILATLAKFYQADASDPTRLDVPDYRQYIDWQDRHACDESVARQTAWFAERSDATPGTRFYSAGRESVSARQTRVTVRLNDEENQAIATSVMVSPFRQITAPLSHFNLFATTMIAWLSRLEQQQSICIGATTHGRSTAAFRETIGLFMQLLPFRVSVDSSETFADLSRKVAAESMGFLSNAIPGAMTSQSQRAFDVGLNLIDLTVEDFCGMPTSMRWLHNGYGDPQRKLTVSAHPLDGDRWELLFDFSDDVFSADDRQRAVQHFRNTLMAVSASPTTRIADYDLLTDSEYTFLAKHGGIASTLESVNLWQRFCKQCERVHDAIAVDGPATQLSYDGLRQMAQDLSERIEDAGFGELVPLLCRRDEKAAIAMMGVLASGRCFMIVDAENPPERVRQLLSQSGVPRMIDATGNSISVLPIASPRQSNCDLAQDACYALFTSGSTGQPQGVVIRHESVWNLLTAFETMAPLQQDCRCAWWTNIGFDVAMYEVFSALLFGRTLCIPSDTQRLSADEMLEWMRAMQIGSAYLPPFFLPALDRRLANGRPLDLKRLLVGVEPIPQRLLASIVDRSPDLKLINGYGPTETTICATLHPIDRLDHSSGPASIGRPVAGNSILIVDSAGQQVPPGVSGELWISGAGLANGYLANPDLMRQRFVMRPATGDDVIWYRSGDCVRMRDDGALEFLGRIDDQLKLSGVRIEPAEITAAIRQCKGVHDCLVLPQMRNGRAERLVALIEGDSAIDVTSIRRHLRTRFAAAMVPSRFIVQPRFPRTINGKIDRRQIEAILDRQRSDDAAQTSATITAPKNAIEFTLVNLIGALLDRKSVGTDDDFFELGGSSLDAMQFVSRANELGISITIQDVFRHRDAKTLASLQTPVPDIPVPSPSDATPVAEFSSGQRSIWYHWNSNRQSPAYQYQVVWKASGRIDPALVRRCLATLIRQHPALRTTVDVQDGVPVPRVHDDLPLAWTLWDHDVTKEAIVAEGRRPFDLASDGPLRALLVRSRDHGDTLAITVHHIAVDQHSLQLLMNQFAHDYIKGEGGLFDGVEATSRVSKPKKIPPSPFSHLPKKRPLSPFSWWRGRLDGCERASGLPFDFEPSAGDSEAGELFRFSLSDRLSAAIHRSASACGVSVGTYLLTAYSVLLSRYSATENFVIGMPVSRRDNWSLEDGEVGFLIEALPFACRIRRDVAFDALAGQISNDFADLLTHRQATHQELSEHFGTLFETMFVPQQPPVPLELGDGLTLIPEVSDLGVSKFDLTWFAADARPRIECAIEFRTNRFKRATIELMSQHWRSLLEQLARDPSQRVGQVDFCTEMDQAAMQALAGNHDTPAIAPHGQTVIERILRRGRKTPDAVAVVCGDESIRYRDLIDRGGKLAERLREAGVGPNTKVAVCLSRSVELVVGILGILQAGGAYVPFDPDLPLERLRQLSARVGTRIVVGIRSGLGGVFETVIDPRDLPRTGDANGARIDAPEGQTLAYILHTSGSTGQPKGVEITHDALLRSTLARKSFYPTAPQRYLMVSPIWFDSSVAGIFWTLCDGGQLILPQDEDVQDVQRLAALIDRHQVTETLVLPSLYLVLVKHANPTLFPTLKRVILAGESCTRSLVRQHFRVLPGARLFNEYGPTEASVWSTVAELRPTDDMISIGRSVEGTPVCLLDRDGASIPIGCIGEIHIGGPRLANGYHADRKLTKQKFIPDPRPGQSGRLYRTGDLARMRRDGSLIFVGRLDEQIKVNGVRIEPAEIESELIGIDGVSDAAVMAVPRSLASVSDHPDAIVAALSELPAEEAQRWIDRALQLDNDVAETLTYEDDHARWSVEIKQGDFIATPRKRQRAWLLNQMLRDSASDLNALDRIARHMVAGSDAPHLPRNLSTERLTEQEIMEDWQTPLMKVMADWATESHGDVLEIGFGRGVAATMIQESGVRSHTVVEMNPHSINDHFVPWRKQYSDPKIRLIPGPWQDNVDKLDTYDSVFFHAFPMNETEFIQYVANSATFAEHFFPVAARLLRDGGVFTYLTTEVDSLSRRHQRSLLEHFGEIQMRVQPLSIPEDTKDAWWADSMLVVRAVK
ncbi:amino acid adenylation domain-containing protein [Stieleria sp. ICT_E10.1]|uniref:non-ribosomal peptide synthetase n=1 Tax=Stieleria sedimenti TaxID=2976331 RepID=UPI0021805764|nr:non-ribosomal peptide synthetase [Stieleria sedimenti]MCS7467126.1 amino acid adenylation domain-containing protein [Stieleria sedimenti]